MKFTLGDLSNTEYYVEVEEDGSETLALSVGVPGAARKNVIVKMHHTEALLLATALETVAETIHEE